MSAAATAAGYLYASGRLRGKNKDKEEHGERKESVRSHEPRVEHRAEQREVRVAVIHERQDKQQAPERQPRQPKIQYRTRRWKPE